MKNGLIIPILVAIEREIVREIRRKSKRIETINTAFTCWLTISRPTAKSAELRLWPPHRGENKNHKKSRPEPAFYYKPTKKLVLFNRVHYCAVTVVVVQCTHFDVIFRRVNDDVKRYVTLDAY